MTRARGVWRFLAVIAGATVLLLGSATTVGLVATVGQTPGPAPTPRASTPEGQMNLTFAEECAGALRPEWRPLHDGNDPGFGLDSDFLGNLSQVTVADGTCTITAIRRPTPSGRGFASAAMATRGAFAQAYGTFEARLRYSSGQGIWPAFWLLKDQPRVGGTPEIDILEAYPGRGGLGGGSGPNVVVSSLHHSRGGVHHFSYDHGSDMTTDFHVYRLVWSPGSLVFSIDGVETGRITRDVPDVAMYPILNLAVGAAGFRTDASTPDVATMEVDYLRVWAP